MTEFEQVRQRLNQQVADAQKKQKHESEVKRFLAMGYSEGVADFAASDLMSRVGPQAEQSEQGNHAAKVAGYRAAGYSEGMAEFAAGMQFKGPNVAFNPE